MRSPRPAIRFLIADDHPVVAEGLVLLSNRQPDVGCLARGGGDVGMAPGWPKDSAGLSQGAAFPVRWSSWKRESHGHTMNCSVRFGSTVERRTANWTSITQILSR